MRVGRTIAQVETAYAFHEVAEGCARRRGSDEEAVRVVGAPLAEELDPFHERWG